jgi:hypothetical protein
MEVSKRQLSSIPTVDSVFEAQRLLQEPFHRRISLVERSVELGWIFAAGFGHVWASAARTANFFCDWLNHFSGLHA